jgi:hypothetical protein
MGNLVSPSLHHAQKEYNICMYMNSYQYWPVLALSCGTWLRPPPPLQWPNESPGSGGGRPYRPRRSSALSEHGLQLPNYLSSMVALVLPPPRHLGARQRQPSLGELRLLSY